MTNKAILITHDRDEMDDRASAFLQKKGFECIWTCPAEGDSPPEIDDTVAALVVYGGKYGVPDKETHGFLKDEMRIIRAALDRDIPVLGICLGAQLLAHELGAKVGPHPDGYHEYGYYPLNASAEGMEVIPDGLVVLQSHYHGFELPPGAVRLAGTERYADQAFRYGDKAYGFQFHPEASRNALTRWIGRRGERNFAKGAFPPERQLADNLEYDGALGRWFNAFLERWIAPAVGRSRAA
jgi:GMP synthase (glutamine-hydrolysing)